MNLRETLLSDGYSRIHYDNEPMETTEEELLEFQIGQEAFHELTLQSNEIERLCEVAVGLENLTKICSFVKNASNVDLALIENATELALAGTGIKCEEVLPSLESYRDTEVSTESIAKFALGIWKSIVKLQKRVRKNTTRFYNSIFKSIPRLRKSIEDLKVRVDGVKEKTLSEGKIDLGGATATLSRDYTAISSLDELKSNLEFYSSFTGVLLGEYTTLASERGEVVSKNIKENILERTEAVVELAKLMLLPKNPLKNSIDRSPMKLNSADLSKDERFNSTDNYLNPIGLNLYQSRYFVTDFMTVRDLDKFLKDNDYNKVEEDERIKVAIDALDYASKNKTEMVMAYSKDRKPKMPKKESVEPLSYSEVEDIIDNLLMICDYVELNSSTDKIKEIEKISDNIEKVTKKLADSIDKQDLKKSFIGIYLEVSS